MQLYFVLSLLSLAVVFTNAQGLLGGERPVGENDPDVAECKQLVLQELRSTESGNSQIDITDFDAKKQVVNGIRYNLSFKATITDSNGEKTTKSCTASLVRPPFRDAKLDFYIPPGKGKVNCS